MLHFQFDVKKPWNLLRVESEGALDTSSTYLITIAHSEPGSEDKTFSAKGECRH